MKQICIGKLIGTLVHYGLNIPHVLHSLELRISSLATILNATPAPYGIVQLATRCGLNQDEMNLLFLHRAGGGNPAAAFVEALPFYHPDKEIRELKKICENEDVVQVADFFQNLDPAKISKN